MAKKITIDDFAAIDKKIDTINEEISEMIRLGASDDMIEKKYVQLGKAVIGKDLAEAQIKEDMNEDQIKAFDRLIKLNEKQKLLELRLSIMERELEETLSNKAKLDEIIADGERVLELVKKTINAVKDQSNATGML